MEESAARRKVGRVGLQEPELYQVGVTQAARQHQRVAAGVLHGRRVQVRQVVERRVVGQHIVDEREVQPGIAVAFEHAHVGVVGQPFVDFVGQRIGLRIRRRRGELANQRAIARARLEHENRPARAPRIEIQRHGDVIAPAVLIDERGRAGHARLLHVDEQNDVVLELRADLQRPRGLQQHAHGVSIVRRPRPQPHRVVVAGQQDRRARPRARDPRHHVFRVPGHHDRAALI